MDPAGTRAILDIIILELTYYIHERRKAIQPADSVKKTAQELAALDGTLTHDRRVSKPVLHHLSSASRVKP